MKVTTKVLGLYHRPDFDGKCSGALIRLYCETKGIPCQLLSVDYMDNFQATVLPLVDADTHVILADFTCNAEVMLEISQRAGEFTWIDHHGDKIREVTQQLVELGSPEISGIRDVRPAGVMLSGCELTWLYLFGPLELLHQFQQGKLDARSVKLTATLPLLVSYLGRYDTWDLEHPNFGSYVQFQLGLRACGPLLPEADAGYLHWRDKLFGGSFSRPGTFDKGFCEIPSILSSIVTQGAVIQAYQDVANEEQLRLWGFEADLQHPKDLELYDYTFFALNTGNKSSQTFKSLFGKYDIFIAYTHNGRAVSVSLYSLTVDVRTIVKAFGGNGHKGAAGFVVDIDKLPFFPTH